MLPASRFPKRGEIWFVRLPTDPPDKGRRPVIVVSVDARNRHERAATVLVIPLTTSIHTPSPFQVLLSAGETGLPADSAARADNVTVVQKSDLSPPLMRLRQVSGNRICEIANKVALAMGCLDSARN